MNDETPLDSIDESAPETTDAPVEEAAVETTDAPVEEAPVDAAPVETEATPSTDRDPSVAVASDETLSEEDRLARINYLVVHPDERTAHDPISADGERV